MRRIDWYVVILWALGGIWSVLIGWLIVHTILNIRSY